MSILRFGFRVPSDEEEICAALEGADLIRMDVDYFPIPSVISRKIKRIKVTFLWMCSDGKWKTRPIGLDPFEPLVHAVYSILHDGIIGDDPMVLWSVMKGDVHLDTAKSPTELGIVDKDELIITIDADAKTKHDA
jgi:hypothetical protein